LAESRGDQHRAAVSQAARQRREREQRQAHHEHLPAAEQVGGTTTEQQEAGERHGVGVHDPLEPGLGEVQRVLHRWQRDVHDRDVQNDHELRQAGEDQGRGQVSVWFGFKGFGHRWFSVVGAFRALSGRAAFACRARGRPGQACAC
jgi:hypothetical protein